ncbi:hypothetical protein HGM15179_004233 [Zosterops borbonicus]|uniref:Uncharacterized protein n=1 Tax=Zosterops borbonicus TaxID=364589 RepID=A0A8K1LQT9_9PASS|nr:hypothetical protein HGM15179_004233 [Zosterops borbonicus]
MVYSNPKDKYRLGGEWIEEVDERLDMIWQGALAAQKANCILGCIRTVVYSSKRLPSIVDLVPIIIDYTVV